MFLKLTWWENGYPLLVNMGRILEIQAIDGGGSELWLDYADAEPDYCVTESPDEILAMMAGPKDA